MEFDEFYIRQALGCRMRMHDFFLRTHEPEFGKLGPALENNNGRDVNEAFKPVLEHTATLA